MSKRIYLFVMLLWLSAEVFTAAAQQSHDTTYTFRFVPLKDMFYVPFINNKHELARLLECVNKYKADIASGKIPLHVEGYCNSMDSEKRNLATAKIRSNRVKSELIIRAGIKEECFITHNHATEGDFVTVSIKVPQAATTMPGAIAETATPPATTPGDARPAKDHTSQGGTKVTTDGTSKDKAAGQTPASSTGGDNRVTTDVSHTPVGGSLSLRANLLRWVTLTPDLGIEWRINPTWGILVNGTWTSWSWSDKKRRYALWEVAPELRYYIGKEKRGYIGAMFKTGEFNYKLSATGRQGDLIGGGLTGGYMLKLNKALSLDFNIGIGYLNADYDKYEVVNGVRVRHGSESKDWWGPVNAGVTLVWLLF